MKTLPALFAMLLLCLLSACAQYDDEEHEKNRMIGMLMHEKYAELEQALAETDQLYQQKTLSARDWQGRWYGLANAASGGMNKRFADWIAQTDSGNAYLLRAMYLQVQAWRQLEDTEIAEDKRQQELERLVTLAETDLQVAQKKIKQCVLCLAERITANRALGRPAKDSLPLLEQALKMDAQISAPLFTYFVSLYPDWGGDLALMKEFMAQMKARKLNQQLLDGLDSRYAWVQAQAARARKDDKNTLSWLEYGFNNAPYDVLMKELADEYGKRGETAKAVEVLEKNLELNNPWDMRTIDLLARAYYADGQRDKGKAMMAKRAEVITRYAAYE